jgi:hypothetical protein
VYIFYRGRPPFTEKIERELAQKILRQKTIEELEEKRVRLKKGQPCLAWSISVPPRIVGNQPSQATVSLQNVGQGTAKDVSLTVTPTMGLMLNKREEIVPLLKPNEKRSLVFQLGFEEEAKKGIYTLQFTARSNQLPTQFKKRFLRMSKIGLLCDARKPQCSGPIKNWFETNAYRWDELQNADDFLKLVRYDLLIVPAESEVSIRGIRNISNFVESGQNLLVMDKVATEEEELLARTLGYSDMRCEVLKSTESLLTIVSDQHPITQGLSPNILPLGNCWGNMCTSTVLTGQILAVQGLRKENELLTVPAIVANRCDKGKTIHFNFHAEETLPQIEPLLTRVMDWLLLPS